MSDLVPTWQQREDQKSLLVNSLACYSKQAFVHISTRSVLRLDPQDTCMGKPSPGDQPEHYE